MNPDEYEINLRPYKTPMTRVNTASLGNVLVRAGAMLADIRRLDKAGELLKVTAGTGEIQKSVESEITFKLKELEGILTGYRKGTL